MHYIYVVNKQQSTKFEILLFEEFEFPTITTGIDGTISLKMSWHTGIEEALDFNSEHVSSIAKEALISLFRDREVKREFEKRDNALVIRQLRND